MARQDFDYTIDDVDSIAESEYFSFVDNYEGLMSKDVAVKVLRKLTAMIKESDFSEESD